MIIIGALLLVTMVYTLSLWDDGEWETGTYEILGDMTETIGNVLFSTYGVVVLFLGLILFAAMLGGVYIAQEDDE